MEVGGRGRLCTYRHTVTTRMTSALSWAAMRAILLFHNCEGQSPKTLSTDHNFWNERRAEADSNRGPSAYQPNALPLSQTGSHSYAPRSCLCIGPAITSPVIESLKVHVRSAAETMATSEWNMRHQITSKIWFAAPVTQCLKLIYRKNIRYNY